MLPALRSVCPSPISLNPRWKAAHKCRQAVLLPAPVRRIQPLVVFDWTNRFPRCIIWGISFDEEAFVADQLILPGELGVSNVTTI
jgi:hypothetical protein